MKYDFDKVISRKGTCSTKWENMPNVPKDLEDVLPLWIADMDFPAPTPVIEALKIRAEHGIYGYTEVSQSYKEAIANWFNRRHNWEVQKDWIVQSPGVLVAISVAIQTFTQPGDKIILQPPVYPPFHRIVKDTGRRILYNQLIEKNGKYYMDFDHLEKSICPLTKMIIFCSPHNPGGRVWTEEELRKLGDICLKNNILIVSDEIHCDLLFKGHKHIPLASLSEELAQNTITCISASKTFNMGGLTTSANIIPNQRLRNLFYHTLESYELQVGNIFGMTALETAFRYGEDWLKELLDYLEDNLQLVVEFCKERIPQIKPMIPEGSYLVWLNCKELGMTQPELINFIVHQAKICLNDGTTFGPGGEGYLRLNIACPRSLLTEGLERLEKAVKSLR